MAAGLQCWNNDDFLQIDGTYKNLMLISKSTVSSVADTAFTYTYPGKPGAEFLQSVTISFAVKNPVIAMRSNYPMVIYRSAISRTPPYNGEMKFAIFTGGQTTSRSVTFYVFGEQVASGSSYGMQIFDSNGVLVFDALNKQMIVAGAHNPAGATTANDFTARTHNYASGRDYAFVLSAPMGFGLWASAGDPVRGWLNGVKNDGSSIVVKQELVEIGGSTAWNLPMSTPRGQLARGIIVLDVTGY